jgi:hypothetical protein
MAKKPSNQGKKWTPEQNVQLRKLAKGNTPTRVIGLKMGRTPGAVEAQAQELNITLMPPNRSPYNRRKK